MSGWDWMGRGMPRNPLQRNQGTQTPQRAPYEGVGGLLGPSDVQALENASPDELATLRQHFKGLSDLVDGLQRSKKALVGDMQQGMRDVAAMQAPVAPAAPRLGKNEALIMGGLQALVRLIEGPKSMPAIMQAGQNYTQSRLENMRAASDAAYRERLAEFQRQQAMKQADLQGKELEFGALTSEERALRDQMGDVRADITDVTMQRERAAERASLAADNAAARDASRLEGDWSRALMNLGTVGPMAIRDLGARRGMSQAELEPYVKAAEQEQLIGRNQKAATLWGSYNNTVLNHLTRLARSGDASITEEDARNMILSNAGGLMQALGISDPAEFFALPAIDAKVKGFVGQKPSFIIASIEAAKAREDAQAFQLDRDAANFDRKVDFATMTGDIGGDGGSGGKKVKSAEDLVGGIDAELNKLPVPRADFDRSDPVAWDAELQAVSSKVASMTERKKNLEADLRKKEAELAQVTEPKARAALKLEIQRVRDQIDAVTNGYSENGEFYPGLNDYVGRKSRAERGKKLATDRANKLNQAGYGPATMQESWTIVNE